jgi:hypothetical protein
MNLFDEHCHSTTVINYVDLVLRLEQYTSNSHLRPTTFFCTFNITDLYTMLLQVESLNDYKKVKGISIDAIRKLA